MNEKENETGQEAGKAEEIKVAETGGAEGYEDEEEDWIEVDKVKIEVSGDE